MEFDASRLFSTANKMLFLAAQTEGTAERLGQHDMAHIVFKRAVEFQQELISTIEQVLQAGSVRPAFSLLRTSLELTTSFAWLADDFDNRLDNFSEGKCPKVQKMMSGSNLGWDEEYKKVYAPLSDFVHGSFVLSDFNKVEKVYSGNESVPSSLFGDYFIVEAEGKTSVRLIEDVSKQELVSMHGGFIATKAFDSILTMLIRASGDYSDSHRWWPERETIEWFDRLVKDNWGGMSFLWLSEKQRLAICRIDGRYA